jgi:hypothetical protein
MTAASMMDLKLLLKDLIRQKELLDSAIALLEEWVAPPGERSAQKSSRGRKSMSPEERKEVSRRMKKYWAARRGKRQNSE